MHRCLLLVGLNLGLGLVACGPAAQADKGTPDAGFVLPPTAPGPSLPSTAVASQERQGTYDRSITAGNPLKGFLTSYQWTAADQRIPHRLEFLYLPISSVLGQENAYAFDTGLEPYLVESEARGHHMILRFYLDYPGREPGLPQWLADQISCTPYSDYGGGCSPDYSDPVLQNVLLEFIAEFGARYDGDHRLGFIQIGLLGFWGEWHTYPHTDIFAEESFQQQLLAAFDEAFESTKILLRYPLLDSPSRDVGFHDDSFAYATLGEIPWFFHPRLVAAGAQARWQQVPIGGEVYPPLQESLFSEDYTLGTYSQDVLRCIEETHSSWMINNGAFVAEAGYEGSQLEAAREASLAMGYEFTVPQISLTASGLHLGTVDLAFTIEIRNAGIAPFYYPLSAYLDDGQGQVWALAEDLQGLQPGQSRVLSLELTDQSVDVLARDFRLYLSSPQLFGDQVIRFADAGDEEGRLTFRPEFGCQVQDQTLRVGQRLETCFCDVDGQLIGDDHRVCD